MVCTRTKETESAFLHSRMRHTCSHLHVVIPAKETFPSLRYNSLGLRVVRVHEQAHDVGSVATYSAFSGRPLRKGAMGPSSPGAGVDFAAVRRAAARPRLLGALLDLFRPRPIGMWPLRAWPGKAAGGRVYRTESFGLAGLRRRRLWAVKQTDPEGTKTHPLGPERP